MHKDKFEQPTAKEMMARETSGEVSLPKFDPPPLFSSNVYIPELNEKKYFGPRGYQNRLSYVLDKSVYSVLEIAQRYNFSIVWKRRLEITVHEARVAHFGCGSQELRCKVTIGDQVRRTELATLVPRSTCVEWNSILNFTVQDPCNIKLEIYVKNKFMPNDVIGHVTILPNQLVENSSVTSWFPLDTQNEIKISMSLSTPEMAPLTFSLATPVSLSFRDCQLLNAKGEKVFTLIGTWPYVLSVLDNKDLSILTVKNKVFEDKEKVFKVYMYGEATNSITVTWFSLQGTNRFYLEGIPMVSQVIYYRRSFNFSYGDTCVAYARHDGKKYDIEVKSCKDSLLLLAAILVIAKLLDSDVK